MRARCHVPRSGSVAGIGTILALAALPWLAFAATDDALPSWRESPAKRSIVEFVSKQDPQTQRLLRNKDDRYGDYDLAVLERALGATHEIVARETLQDGLRTLLHARPRR